MPVFAQANELLDIWENQIHTPISTYVKYFTELDATIAKIEAFITAAAATPAKPEDATKEQEGVSTKTPTTPELEDNLLKSVDTMMNTGSIKRMLSKRAEDPEDKIKQEQGDHGMNPEEKNKVKEVYAKTLEFFKWFQSINKKFIAHFKSSADFKIADAHIFMSKKALLQESFDLVQTVANLTARKDLEKIALFLKAEDGSITDIIAALDTVRQYVAEINKIVQAIQSMKTALDNYKDKAQAGVVAALQSRLETHKKVLQEYIMVETKAKNIKENLIQATPTKV